MVQNGVLNDLKNEAEIFTICAPKTSNLTGLMNRYLLTYVSYFLFFHLV